MLGLNLKKVMAVLFLGGALAQFQPIPSPDSHRASPPRGERSSRTPT